MIRPTTTDIPAGRAFSDYRAEVGEGPVWDAARQCVWWVDIFGRALLRTCADGLTRRFAMPEMAAGVALASDGAPIVAMETALFRVDPDNGRCDYLSAPDNLPATHRFNDLTVDSHGRLVIGTMRKSALGSAPTGTLYLFDRGIWRVLLDGFTTINGLAVAPDGKRLYWSDSAPHINRIWCAEYDPETATLGPTHDFVDMHLHRGRPDGAAIDAEGGYWIAGIGAGCLHRFLPSGTLDQTIALPVDYPTKPVFAGADLSTLYVTSLSIRESSAERQANAGHLVQLKAPVRGHSVAAVAL